MFNYAVIILKMCFIPFDNASIFLVHVPTWRIANISSCSFSIEYFGGFFLQKGLLPRKVVHNKLKMYFGEFFIWRFMYCTGTMKLFA